MIGDDEIGEDDFVWTFPTFLLARNFVTDPVTGDVHFNRDLQFIAPMVNPRGEQGIAMFTDRHLAEEFLEMCKTNRDMRLLKIPIGRRWYIFCEMAQRSTATWRSIRTERQELFTRCRFRSCSGRSTSTMTRPEKVPEAVAADFPPL